MSGEIPVAAEYKRSFNSNDTRRKLDNRAGVRIKKLSCSPVLEGHARWTIRLLEEKF